MKHTFKLDVPNPKTYIAINSIVAERERQDYLKSQDRFKYTCADWELSNAERLAVLVEEVGEVAREVLGEADLTTDGKDKLKTELVECAAIITAWLERYVK
jgi:NTP pyrophosphatase (non-canonical NTP hydrolase)